MVLIVFFDCPSKPPISGGADIVYIRSIMNAYVKKLYFPIVIPHTGVFPYLAVYDQLSGLSITPEELNLTL